MRAVPPFIIENREGATAELGTLDRVHGGEQAGGTGITGGTRPYPGNWMSQE